MTEWEPKQEAISGFERGAQCLAVALCASLVAVHVVKAELQLPAEHRLDIFEAQYAMVVLAERPALEMVPASLAVAAEAVFQYMARRSGRWWWCALTSKSCEAL
jgi:hypothetical protein